MPRTLEAVPNARVSDPLSSHLAGEEVTLSGARRRFAELVLEMVQARPGMTSAELAHWRAVDRYAVARRLPDLEHEERVHQGKGRKCEVSGRLAVTWWPGPGPRLEVPIESEAPAGESAEQGVLM